jgi:hypothetical protein
MYAIAQVIRHIGSVFTPKSSMQRNSAVTGQFVTPQKRHERPIAAPREQSRSSNGAIKLPKVEPTKNTGSISPPLKPAPRVRAVNKSFRMNC